MISLFFAFASHFKNSDELHCDWSCLLSVRPERSLWCRMHLEEQQRDAAMLLTLANDYICQIHVSKVASFPELFM